MASVKTVAISESFDQIEATTITTKIPIILTHSKELNKLKIILLSFMIVLLNVFMCLKYSMIVKANILVAKIVLIYNWIIVGNNPSFS